MTPFYSYYEFYTFEHYINPGFKPLCKPKLTRGNQKNKVFLKSFFSPKMVLKMLSFGWLWIKKSTYFIPSLYWIQMARNEAQMAQNTPTLTDITPEGVLSLNTA